MNIWTDCEKVPLPTLLSFIVDNRGKTVPTANEGHILIATNCIKNDHLYPVYEKVRYLSQETYETFFRAHPIPGDIIFVNKGTPGRCAIVPDPVDFCIAQDMMSFRVDKNKINNVYLLSILRSYEIQKLIHSISVGDVIPHFKKQMLDKILIPIPPFEIQNKIASFFFDINRKIEINNRINENLEQQAQALFKYWFVDFEPFRDQPFVESDLGMIPEGWRVDNLDYLCSFISRGLSPKYKENTNQWVLGQTCVRNNIVTLTNARTHEPKANTEKKVKQWDTLINSTGIGSLGRVGIVYFDKDNIAFDSHLTVVRTKDELYKHYIGRNLLMRQLEIENMAIGSTGQTELPKESVKTMQLIVPDKASVQRFNKIIEPIALRMYHTFDESHRLSQLRDTLLPKLMSGEIKL